MRAERKRIVVIAGSVVALIVIAAIVTVVLFDINSYKSKIETAASETTGLDVRINGRMRLSLFPFGISAKDIHAFAKGGEILSLEHLKLGAELMPLLEKQLKVTSCELVKPVVTIVKDGEGKHNFEGIRKELIREWLGTASSLNELKLTQGTLVYLDSKAAEKTELKEINLAIKDLTVADTSGEIMKSASFAGNMDCKEALQRDVRIESLKTGVKAIKGMYSFQPITIRSLVYSDRRTGEKAELKGINLVIKDLTVADTSRETIKSISFTGNMDCEELRKKDLRVDSITSSISAEKGVFCLKPLTMNIFGAKGEGDVMADRSGVDVQYRINLRVPNLDFEKLEGSFGVKKMISGKGELVASLTMKEKGGRNLLNSIYGTMALRGDNLVTHTVDLDKVLSAYETSQKFSLVDIGAFFIAGPLGPIALKGYRYGNLYYQTQGGRGTITKFVSHWKINKGEADAEDCALATLHNRVALKGKLNFVRERYDHVTVALLDEKGCAKLKQDITGSFGDPRVSVVSSLESLAGPIVNAYRQAKRFAQGDKCEVIYRGSVQQPH